MRIQNNIMALNTHRQYNIANNSTAGSAEKLSSGYKINRAGDDAAGLAISEKMRAQIRGLNMASKNSLDAVSLIQTAEGALQSTHDILQRMRELAVQSSSDGNEQVIDRGALDQEFQALKKEIDDTAAKTRFNDQNLIDGTFQKAFYSTNITASALTAQTIADVSRVGVKSGHSMDGSYKVDVQYIKGTPAIYARTSEVDTQVSTEAKRILLSSDAANGNGTSIINRVEFAAVAGAKHNGKTFTISAQSGSGSVDDKNTSDLKDLKITMSDKDTTYTGTVISTEKLAGGSKVSISFDGVGTMTLYLDEDIEELDQKLYNISSALNTKQIKFIQAAEAEMVGGAYDVASASPYAGSVTGGVNAAEVTAGTFATVTKTGTVTITGTPVSAAVTNGPAADIAITGLSYQFDGVTVNTVTALLKAVPGDGTNPGAATYKLELDMGDYGTYSVDVVLTAIDTQATIPSKITTALAGFSLDIAEAPPAYTIGTKFDAASVDTANALRTDLVATAGSAVAAGTGTAGDPILDFSALAYTVTDAAGNAVAYTVGGTQDLAGGTGNIIVTETFAPNGAEGELNYRITLEGYGSFDLHIGAQKDRTAADLATEVTTALNAITQNLGDMNEGVDTVKKVDDQIALTLKGEVVMLSENDTKAAFDSSGLTLTFRPLDFSGISSDATARNNFTNSATAAANVIEITVVENDGKALTIQTGANQGDEMQINIDAMNLQLLGLTDSNIATQKSASRAITEVNNAINQVSTQRAALGALQNRLNFKIANLDTSAENLQAAESRIRDVDMAAEMTKFTKSNILVQAATAMLAQANSQPQNVLQLLR